MSPALLLALALAADPCALEDPPPAPAPVFEPADWPSYPLGPRLVPDFLAPGDPFTLTDLRYSLVDGGEARHAFAARVRFKDAGYFGAEFDGDRQAVSFLMHRLSGSAAVENGEWTLGAAWRAPRFVASFDARRRGGDDGTWVSGPTLFVRVLPEVEVYGWAEADSARPEDRLFRRYGAGAFFQRGATLEGFGEWVRRYEGSSAGGENRTDSGLLQLTAQVGRAELYAEGALDDTDGRFPRTESEAAGRARVPLAGRLLLEAGGGGRFDSEAGDLRHEYGGFLGWHGRRVTLPRGGEAARHAVALAREARGAREYELSAFDDEGLRAQRERLSLSPQREALRDEMEAVYRAQVAERLVPLLGAGVTRRVDVLSGESAVVASALLGVPWPPAWPWRASEASVPFLRLDLSREWVTTAGDWRSHRDRATLTVALDREMDLVLGYARLEPTALDVVRGIGTRSVFRVSYVYARGR